MAYGKRRQIFVDPKVQGALVARTVVYWGFCVMAVTLMLLCWRIFTVPGRSFAFQLDWIWFHYCPAVFASLLLLPIVVLDSIRLSNRFAGPMMRLRRAMHRLAEGEDIQPINFRDNDFWSEFAEDFNRMLARQQCLLHEVSDEHSPGEVTSADIPEQLENAIEQELANDSALENPSDSELELEVEAAGEVVGSHK